MGRPRKQGASWRPKGVYLVNGRYVYREYLGDGKFGKDIRLCPGNATEAQVWSAYHSIVGIEQAHTLTAMFAGYRQSNEFTRLAVKTRKDYESNIERLCATPCNDQKFGSIPYSSITRGVMQLFMDYHAKTPVQANRMLAVASCGFAWAARRDMVAVNPCTGVRRFTETPRRRYVSDEEYETVYAAAPDRLRVAMELAYLCRLREKEIVALTRAHAKPDGLLATRVKGSKTQIIGMTPRLRLALDISRTLCRAESIYLVPASDGGKLTAEGLRTAWQAFRKEMRERDTGKLTWDWTFHDLKAKGVSDFEGDPHEASGHKTREMTEVYDRRLRIVPATK